MSAAAPVANGIEQDREHSDSKRGMIFRSAGHGIDFAVEKLMLSWAGEFQTHVVAIGIAMKSSSH
jgi:hypothetical protein